MQPPPDFSISQCHCGYWRMLAASGEISALFHDFTTSPARGNAGAQTRLPRGGTGAAPGTLVAGARRERPAGLKAADQDDEQGGDSGDYECATLQRPPVSSATAPSRVWAVDASAITKCTSPIRASSPARPSGESTAVARIWATINGGRAAAGPVAAPGAGPLAAAPKLPGLTGPASRFFSWQLRAQGRQAGPLLAQAGPTQRGLRATRSCGVSGAAVGRYGRHGRHNRAGRRKSGAPAGQPKKPKGVRRPAASAQRQGQQ